MIPPQLSGSDWKNLEDSGGLFAAAMYALCVAMVHQQNGDLLISLLLAVPLFILITLSTILVIVVFAVPFWICQGIAWVVNWLIDHAAALMPSRRTNPRRTFR